jgi:AraC-like DNA-binding protein
MVYRVYVEKKQGLEAEAKSLRYDIRHLLGIKALEDVRIVNRYDVENIEKDLFDYAVKTVFSEPQLDNVSEELNFGDATIFAVEFLPGQFDQRADSAAQCIQIISQKERPLVKTAKVYALYGSLSADEVDRIKKHLINPVESQEASLEKYETLKVNYSIPETVETLTGFISMNEEELAKFVNLSPNYFVRKFKKRTGHSPIQFVKMIKLERAKFLLEQSFEPVNAIMEQLGFYDAAHFSKMFKLRYGHSPKKYREIYNYNKVVL